MRVGADTRAIVTGASAGLGAALVRELAGRGATVGLLARRRDLLERLAADLPAASGDHIVLAADVAKRREVERAVERFAKRTGGIDLFCANAGVAHYGPFADVPIERAEEMIRVNVLGAVLSIHAALSPMLAAARGHIVVTASGAALRAFPGAAVYGGTKAFERGFAEALRHELSGTGISLTTIFPGEVATDLHAHQPDSLPDWRRSESEIDPADLARRIVRAVETDERDLYAPQAVRLLGLNSIAPRLTDRLLARVRGRTAAPRLD